MRSVRSATTLLSVVLFTLGLTPAAASASPERSKKRVVSSIDRQSPELIDLADRIWQYAETALRETRSAAALAAYAEAQGLTVERGIAGMPTAFVASYGEGRPVIAVLGEYDALPGMSQKITPQREPVGEGAPGHACGHNLFGTASLAAAVAIKELIAAGRLAGTVRFYGTPAEESVGGKIYMVRAGLFDDVDAAITWHPASATLADTLSSQAMVDLAVEFRGSAAHAAYDPWNGRSALDAAELFTHSVNLLREHVQPTVRIHYVITDGGDIPNVVPEHARVWCWLRDNTHHSVETLLGRLQRIVDGVALASEVEGRLTVQSGDWEMLVNMAGAKVIQANLEALGPVPFRGPDHELARQLQRATGVEPTGLDAEVTPLERNPGPPDGGSTDVADVSWVTPTLHLSVTTAAENVPWHGWTVAAASGTSIGHVGMIYAAKALAMTMVDLFADPGTLAEVRREFEEKTQGIVYQSFLPDGPPPIPVE